MFFQCNKMWLCFAEMKRKNTKSESQESWARRSCKPPNNSSSSRGSGKQSSGPTRRSRRGRCRRWWRGSRRSTLPKVERRFEAGSVLDLRGWRCRPGWWRSWGRARRGWSRTSGCGRQDRRARARRKGKRRGKREWLRLEEFLSTFSVLSLGLKLRILLPILLILKYNISKNTCKTDTWIWQVWFTHKYFDCLWSNRLSPQIGWLIN